MNHTIETITKKNSDILKLNLECPKCGNKDEFKVERKPNGVIECTRCTYFGTRLDFIESEIKKKRH